MESVVFTQLTIPEVRSIFRQELEGFFSHSALTTNPTEDANEYLSRAQVADRFHITGQTVNQWIKVGRLKGYRIGRRVLFKSIEVDSAIKAINVGK